MCKRVGIKDHISKSCPRTQIKCKYYDIGCKTKVCRIDMSDHMEESATPHVTLLADLCEKLKMDVLRLEYEHDTLQKLRDETQVVNKENQRLEQIVSELRQANAVSVLHVSNCPPTTNEQKLRSLFGQHGTVRCVEWDPDINHAFIYYTDNKYVQRALTKNAHSGINLHQTKLHIHEVKPNVNE